MNFEISVALVWLLASCILMLSVMFLHYWRISLVCLAMKLVSSWVELGFNLGMEAFGWVLVDWCPLKSGVFWCSQDLDLSLLPLAFILILTVASRLLHPHSTDDKPSRLMVKQVSTVRNTQGSQSYMEKRRGMREIEVTRRRRRGIKREESSLASNQFPMCSPQSGTLRDVQRVT